MARKPKNKPYDPYEKPANKGNDQPSWRNLMEYVKKNPGSRRWINRQLNKPVPRKSPSPSETPPPPAANKRKKKK